MVLLEQRSLSITLRITLCPDYQGASTWRGSGRRATCSGFAAALMGGQRGCWVVRRPYCHQHDTGVAVFEVFHRKRSRMKSGQSRPKEEPLASPRLIPERERILTNVAYLMGDVTDTLMLDAYCRVYRAGFDMKQSIKQRWRYAVDATHRAERAWKQLMKELYEHDSDTEALCEESDWFADMIVLIADRAGDDPKRREMIRRQLLRMKSTLGIYDKD